MKYDAHRKTVLFRATVLIVAICVVAGPGAASAVTPAGEAAPDGDGYSLRHIPEALPLSNEMAAADWSASDWYDESDPQPEGELSMTKAVLYSLLLPGLGDWYAGRKDRATAFFIVDAALWTTFIAFRVQGHEREDGYKEFAQLFAGVESTDHSDDFYSEIGQYDSSDQYEAVFKKDSRLVLWPDVGSEALDQYYVENRVADFEEWAWSSFESRVDYRQMRSSSKLSYRRSEYMLAALALNRVIASVFAYSAVRASRDDGESSGNGAREGGYRLDISTPAFGERGDFTTRVSLIRSF
jgi:hypothetical protein